MKKLVFMILALLIMMGCANISEVQKSEAEMNRIMKYYEEEVQNFPGGIQ